MEHYCDACKHNGVCKYKEGFEAKRKEIKDLVENVKTEDNPVIVDIKCEFYLDSIVLELLLSQVEKIEI